MTKVASIEQRRQLGLCYKCGEKYSPVHNCKRQVLHLKGRDEEKKLTDEIEVADEIEGGISLHALKRYPSNKIIKVGGQAKGKKLIILIDSDSTHSFLNENTPMTCVVS